MEEVGQQEEEEVEEVVAVMLQRHKKKAIQVQCSTPHYKSPRASALYYLQL